MSKNKRQYSAVIFSANEGEDLRDREVAVVPYNWILKEEEVTYSYWPIDTSLDSTRLYDKCIAPPITDDDEMEKWSKFKLDVEEGPFDYVVASKHADRMKDPEREDGRTTAYEDDDGKKLPRKRINREKFTGTEIKKRKRTSKNEAPIANKMFQPNPLDDSDSNEDDEKKRGGTDESVKEIPSLESSALKFRVPADMLKKIGQNKKAAAVTPPQSLSSSSKVKPGGHVPPTQRNIKLNIGLSKSLSKTPSPATKSSKKEVMTKKKSATSSLEKLAPKKKQEENVKRQQEESKPKFRYGFRTSGQAESPKTIVKPKATSSPKAPPLVEISDDEDDDDDDYDDDFKSPPSTKKSMGLKSGNFSSKKEIVGQSIQKTKKKNRHHEDENSQRSTGSFSTVSSISEETYAESPQSNLKSKDDDETSQDVYSESRQDDDPILDESIVDSSQPDQSLTGTKKLAALQIAIKSGDVKQILTAMATTVGRLDRKLYTLTDMIKNLDNKLNMPKLEDTMETSQSAKWTTTLPLQSQEQVMELENQLAEDPSIRADLHRQCRLLTGTTVSRLAANVVRQFLSSSVAASFKWSATADDSKLPSFQKLQSIILLMSDIVLEKFPSVEKTLFTTQFHEGMRNVLRNIRQASRGDVLEEENVTTGESTGGENNKEDDDEETETKTKKKSNGDNSDDSTATVAVEHGKKSSSIHEDQD